MRVVALHHVSIPVRDLDRSLAFYRDLLGLTELARPDFGFAGAWLAAGPSTLHLIVNPAGTYRPPQGPDSRDIHVALAVEDFGEALARLEAAGYGTAADRPIKVSRHSRAGFPQIFLADPDGHVVELNQPVGGSPAS